MQTNETILDVFDSEIRRLFNTEPAEYHFGVEVTYAFDNRPTGEQQKAIRAFVSALRGRKPPFRQSLDLGEGLTQISVTDGSGTAFMSRGLSLNSPEPLDKNQFLAKVCDKANEARAQMKNTQCLKVLVINFDSPSGDISQHFVSDAKKVMREAFNGDVDPYFLLYRHLV